MSIIRIVKRNCLSPRLRTSALSLAACSLILLALAACGKDGPLPPTSTASTDEPAVTVSSTQMVENSPVPLSPTALLLPTADFEGISLSYDDALLGPVQEASIRPAQPPTVAMLARPAHFAVTFAGSDHTGVGELLVFEVRDYKKIADLAAAHISNLTELLAARPVQPSSPLLLFPTTNIAAAFITEPAYVKFTNGSGIAFVAAVEDNDSEQPLFVFQAITNDQSYFATLLLPIKATLGEAAIPVAGDVEPVLNQAEESQALIRHTQNALSKSLSSLEIYPREDPSAEAPAAYVTSPGVLLGYDPALSGTARSRKKPPVYESDDGRAEYLENVPDEIEVSFGAEGESGEVPLLRILPVRGQTGQFYASVPVELRQKVETLESEAGDKAEEEEPLARENFARYLQFQSGWGKRSIKEITPSSDDGTDLESAEYGYEFQGITGDGRYYIDFSHSLRFAGIIDDTLLDSHAEESTPFFEELAALDGMVQSLVVDPEASTQSSMPENDPECVNEAQFVEDINTPPEMIVEGGQTFTKTWRIRNSGTCTWTPMYDLIFAGGNPLQWERSSVLDIVNPGEETQIGTQIVSPGAPGKYNAWWQLVDATGTPFGPFLTVLFESPRPVTDIPGYGVISGDLTYPASGMPAMTIYFLRTDDRQRFALETEDGWNHYANEIPVGEYYVFARVTGDESDSGGGYTESVLCGMKCGDHSLIAVTIEEGKETGDINIADWYAPAGTFPLP